MSWERAMRSSALNSGLRTRASSEVESSINEHILDAIIIIDRSLVFAAKSCQESYKFRE